MLVIYLKKITQRHYYNHGCSFYTIILNIVYGIQAEMHGLISLA